MTTTLPPRVRGECPGVHTPFVEADGALLRIRIPGGIVSAAGLRAAAALGGTLEITSRANLQLRGLDPGSVPAVAAHLVAAGLTLPDPAQDERRNVLASPTAGFDPSELVDSRALVAAVASMLADPQAGERSPKFGVLVDGGGAVSVRGRRHDVCLGAVRLPDSGTGFEVRLDEPLPTQGIASGPAVFVEERRALDAVRAALALCPPGGRMADALAAHGREWTGQALARACGGTVTAAPVGRGEPGAAPIGLYQAAPSGEWAGTLWCGAAPLLGRMDPEAAAGLATLADDMGRGEIRLTPWRGVVVPGVAPADASAVVGALAGLGLSCDAADPLHRVVACAGRSGCHSGLTDTQSDGARLVELLRAASPAGAGGTVHLSGCPKGCAARAQADLTLVGGPEAGAYELYRRDPAAGGFGRRVATGLGSEAALVAATDVTGSQDSCQ